MVLEAVEVVERRAPSRVVAARASSVGVEVPLQGHGTNGETGGFGRAMQIAHRVEAPVLMVHGFCRKVRFLGQNPKIGYQEFNELQTPQLSKKQLCDRTLMPQGN